MKLAVTINYFDGCESSWDEVVIVYGEIEEVKDRVDSFFANSRAKPLYEGCNVQDFNDWEKSILRQKATILF